MKAFIFLFSVLFLTQTINSDVFGFDKENRATNNASDIVIITPVAIQIPLGKILLVRKDKDFCAIKFTKFWNGKTDQDWYANYESNYQDDKTGDFLNNNVVLRKDKLSFPKPRGIGRFAFSFGNKDIQCGPIKLFWFGQGSVYFFSSSQKEKDYGVELAPTKWNNITQVNVFDPRLKWYKYDSKRQNMNILVEDLWKSNEGGR